MRAEGVLDFRGTKGVVRDAPVGFRALRLIFSLDTDADPEALDQLVATTERYCLVLQKITGVPDVDVSITATRRARRGVQGVTRR